MKALVFGCGPSGLMATHAAAMRGYDVVVISKKRKSEMFGCQYLHQPIPLVTNEINEAKVEYKLQGTVEGYRRKVYGSRAVTTSPESLGENHSAWNIRDTYNRLWEMYGSYVIDTDLSVALEGDELKGLVTEADRVFSTVPAPLLCKRTDNHMFHSEKVWSIGDAPERGIFSPVKVAPNTAIVNGEDSPAWYRASNVFGYSTVEWPHDKRPPLEGVSEIVKPLSTTCDCRPGITRLGRYGKWTKGVLSHTAFFDVYDSLEDWTLF